MVYGILRNGIQTYFLSRSGKGYIQSRGLFMMRSHPRNRSFLCFRMVFFSMRYGMLCCLLPQPFIPSPNSSLPRTVRLLQLDRSTSISSRDLGVLSSDVDLVQPHLLLSPCRVRADVQDVLHLGVPDEQDVSCDEEPDPLGTGGAGQGACRESP